MAEIASAYLSIIPSMKGAGAAIVSGSNKELGAAGKTLGGTLGKALVAGIAVAAAGVAVAGKALYSIGSTFDDVSDTIRVKTGATGAELGRLEDSAKRVGKSIPVAFSEIAPTLADLNQRIGVTGPVLEKLTEQFLEAGRITGEALDTKTFTAAFNAFDVKGTKTTKVMDELFRVSQETGVGLNDLASSVARNAPNLKQFGFSIGESASLIGTLDKAGLDSNRTLATLSRAMVTFAKDGKDPQVALRGTVDQIEKFTKAGDDAAAINLAGKIFGTRGASQFVAAIKSGKVNLADLTKLTSKNSDSILDASKDTRDFSEQWQLFKNRAMVTLEPIATRVFGTLTRGAELVNSKLVPAVKAFVAEIHSGEGAGGQFVAAFERVSAVISPLAGFILNNKAAVGTFVGVILTVVLAVKAWTIAQAALNLVMTANPIGLVIVAIAALAAGLVYAYKKSDTFRAIVDKAFGAIGELVPRVVSGIISFVKNNWKLLPLILLGPIGIAAIGVIKNFDKIQAGASALIGAVKGKFNDLIGFFKGIPGAIGGIFDGLWSGVANSLKGALNSVLSLPLTIPRVDTHIPGVGTVGGQTLIPALAKGGIVNSPTLAMIGEAGPEMVLPLGRNGGLADTNARLDRLIAAVEQVAPGVGSQINSASRAGYRKGLVMA